MGFILLLFFHCVCFYRDLLPFTLKLPQAIFEASSFQDLEIISSLGIGKSLKAVRFSLGFVRTMVPCIDIMQPEDRWTIVFGTAKEVWMQKEDVYDLYVHSRMLRKRALAPLAINLHLDFCAGCGTYVWVSCSFQQLKCSTASWDNLYTLEVAGIWAMWKTPLQFLLLMCGGNADESVIFLNLDISASACRISSW